MLEREFGGHITQPEEETDSLSTRVFFGLQFVFVITFSKG